MTAPANFTRAARICSELLTKNPSLTAEQLAKAAALVLRAEMIKLRSKGTQKPAEDTTG